MKDKLVEEFADSHELVSLLVSRIRAHPEEFATSFRWDGILSSFSKIATPEEQDIIKKELYHVRMDNLRDQFLDELMNGDDRRAAIRNQSMLGSGHTIQAAALQTQSDIQRFEVARKKNMLGALGLPTLGGK